MPVAKTQFRHSRGSGNPRVGDSERIVKKGIRVCQQAAQAPRAKVFAPWMPAKGRLVSPQRPVAGMTVARASCQENTLFATGIN